MFGATIDFSLTDLSVKHGGLKEINTFGFRVNRKGKVYYAF